MSVNKAINRSEIKVFCLVGFGMGGRDRYYTFQYVRKEKYRFHISRATQFRIQKQYSDCLTKEDSYINY